MVLRFVFCFMIFLLSSCSNSHDEQAIDSESEKPPILTWHAIWPPAGVETNLKDFWVSENNPDEIIVIGDFQESEADDRIEIYASYDGGLNWSDVTVRHNNYAPSRFGLGEQVSEATKRGKDPSDFLMVTRPISPVGHTGIFSPPIMLRNYQVGALSTEVTYIGSNATYKVVANSEGSIVIYISERWIGGAGGPSALFRSHDGGVSFQSIGAFFPRFWAQEEDASLIGCAMQLLDAHPDGTVAVYCDGLYFSHDTGGIWHEMTSPVPVEEGFFLFPALYLSPANSAIAYTFDKSTQRLYRYDGAWTEMTLPGEPESITLSQDDAETIYGAVGNRGVFKSIDGGVSWEDLNNGLDDISAEAVKISNDQVFLKTDQGIYVYR